MCKKALILLAMVFLTASLGAQTGNTAVRSELQGAGYQVTASRTQGGMPVWDLRTDDGLTFSLSMIGSFSESRARAVKSLLAVIQGLDGLSPESIRVVFENNRATAIVTPRRFVIDGKEYRSYMPSGMQFVYDEAPAYDFRMLVDNLAVRINGAFLTTQQFLNRIVRAVENPAAYIQSSDPQFLAQQIQELQRLFDQLAVGLAQQEAESAMADEELAQEIESGRREGQAQLDGIVRQGRREIAAATGRMDGIEEALRDEIETLRAETAKSFESVIEESVVLADEFSRMRRGSVILATRNMFGSLKEVSPETLEQLVELRKDNPDLLPADALSRVNEGLPEGEPELHKKHVQAVYAFYFNDYR